MKELPFQGKGPLPLTINVRILKLCLPAGRQGTRLFVPSIQALHLIMTQRRRGEGEDEGKSEAGAIRFRKSFPSGPLATSRIPPLKYKSIHYHRSHGC
jgi:hypothetical protein